MRRIRVPGDKSVTQRALVFASLASGESRLRGLLPGEDPQATAAVLRALGVDIPPFGGDGAEVRIQGVGLRGLQAPQGVLDFENSGTGARRMLGVLAGQPITATVTGDGSLQSRPMRRVTTPLSKMGAVFREMGEPDRLPLEMTGGALTSLDYDSPVARAQIKSALLLAGLVGGASVRLSEPYRSRDHTERMLGMCGVPVASHQADDVWRVELRDPPEQIAPIDLEVPGEIRAIVNGHFRLERKIEGFSFLGLSGGLGQWLFVRGGVASVTVSAADDLAEEDNASIAGRLWADVALALGLGDVPLPPHRIVKEKRATFAQTPEQEKRRPGARTGLKNLFLAGDWTATGLPATIEGSIRSGRTAAYMVLSLSSKDLKK